jgi:hypothetical protein
MKAKPETQAALGLDVGTSRIVLASQEDEAFKFDTQLNAFVCVPFSRMTEKALTREGVPFARNGSDLLVHGNEAPRFADLLNSETRRPMTQGVLNPAEPESVPVMRQIVEAMTSSFRDNRPKLCFTVPAWPLAANGVNEEGLTYHEATLRQIFAELDYEVLGINEGLAVIYSELEDTNFTGIGISCGGGLCNVALSYLSMPAMSFSIPKAGDYIDSSAATVTGDLANRVRLVKEERFHFNGHFVDKLQQVLTVYYDDMINGLLTAMKEAFSNPKRMPKLSKPIPLVLSGGTASPKGFRDRFEKLLRATDFPIQISEVRLARDPHTATARGALIAALTEMQ